MCKTRYKVFCLVLLLCMGLSICSGFKPARAESILQKGIGVYRVAIDGSGDYLIMLTKQKYGKLKGITTTIDDKEISIKYRRSTKAEEEIQHAAETGSKLAKKLVDTCAWKLWIPYKILIGDKKKYKLIFHFEETDVKWYLYPEKLGIR